MTKTMVSFRGAEDARTLTDKLVQAGYARDSFKVYTAHENCDGASIQGSVSAARESQTIVPSVTSGQPFAFAVGDNVTISTHRRKPNLVGKRGAIVSRRLAHGKPLYNMNIPNGNKQDLIKDLAQSSLTRC